MVFRERKKCQEIKLKLLRGVLPRKFAIAFWTESEISWNWNGKRDSSAPSRAFLRGNVAPRRATPRRTETINGRDRFIHR